jgi:hypothetical protein
MLDYDKAKTITYNAMQTEWDAACAIIVGDTKQIRFDRLPYDKAPPVDDHWSRITLAENNSFQSGFTARVNSDKRAFDNEGLLILQMFAPKKPATFVKDQDSIARLMRNSFRKVKLVDEDGCRIVLTGARILQMPDEDGMVAINVTADFKYRETQ